MKYHTEFFDTVEQQQMFMIAYGDGAEMARYQGDCVWQDGQLVTEIIQQELDGVIYTQKAPVRKFEAGRSKGDLIVKCEDANKAIQLRASDFTAIAKPIMDSNAKLHQDSLSFYKWQKEQHLLAKNSFKPSE